MPILTLKLDREWTPFFCHFLPILRQFLNWFNANFDSEFDWKWTPFFHYFYGGLKKLIQYQFWLWNWIGSGRHFLPILRRFLKLIWCQFRFGNGRHFFNHFYGGLKMDLMPILALKLDWKWTQFFAVFMAVFKLIWCQFLAPKLDWNWTFIRRFVNFDWFDWQFAAAKIDSS